MPALLLLRHAKAEPGSPAGDHDRALSDRGRRDAAAMGKVIAERFTNVGAVLCSTSTRTRQTWDEVSKALGGPEPTFLREIYDASGDYVAVLRSHGGPAESVLLIGHNPAIQATALALSASADEPSGTSISRKFPTAALAVLDVEGDWANMEPGEARLREFITPPEVRPDP